MPEYRWYGPVALIEAARDALPHDAAVIGAMVPPWDEPVTAWDGMAGISFVSTVPQTPPAGLYERPELLTALQGALDA